MGFILYIACSKMCRAQIVTSVPVFNLRNQSAQPNRDISSDISQRDVCRNSVCSEVVE